MIFVLLAVTAFCGLFLFQGAGLDATSVATVCALLLAWSPRVFFGVVLKPSGTWKERWMGKTEWPKDFSSSLKADRIANLFSKQVMAMGVVLIAFMAMSPLFVGQTLSSEFVIATNRFFALTMGGLLALVMGMVDFPVRAMSAAVLQAKR